MAIGLLRHSCDIKRMTDVGTAGKRELTAFATAVPCLLLPASSESDLSIVKLGQGYTCYFNPDVDVQVTDTLVDTQGKEYTVKGKSDYHSVGNVSYKSVICEMNE